MDSSALISAILAPIRSLFFFHKKKLAFFIFALVLFILFLFPYSDLTSFSQEKVNASPGMRQMGGQVSYPEIKLNLSPFGMQVKDFEFSSNVLKKPLKIGSVTARPNLWSLLKFQPGGSLVLSDFFGGESSLSFGLNGKTEEKTQKFSADLNLNGVSLLEILKFQGLPYKFTGKIFGDLNAEGEDSFRMQPKGDFKFNLQNVTIPSELPLPAFTLELPTKVVWKNSNLFGRFEKGRILITEGTLGTKSAPINGRYKGFINCQISKTAAACTDYDLRFEIELDSNFQKNVASGLSAMLNSRMVNIIKLPQGGAKYLFSVQGNAARKFQPPSVRSLSNFE